MIHSVGFVDVRTEAFAAMTAFHRDVLGLAPILERPGAAWFRAWNHYRAPDGNVYGIIGPDRAGTEPAAGS